MALFEIKAGGKSIFRIGAEGSKKSLPSSVFNGALDGSHLFRAIDYMSAATGFFDINSAATIAKAVNECPQVSTILFRKAQAHANGKVLFTDTKGNELTGEKLKKWERVFTKPNAFQNRRQYVSQLEIFLGSSGWCVEYKENSLGFGVEQMTRRLLDPLKTEIVWKRKTMFGVTNPTELIYSLHYTENGIRREILDLENVYIYTTPNVFAVNSGFLPESPLKTLKYPINNSIINYKTRNRLIKKPFGFVSGKAKDEVSTIPLTPGEKADIQKEYRQNYGTEFDDQDDLIISPVELTFTPFMPPIGDMKLLELLKSDSATICDVLGYEYDLLARDLGGVALNNKNEAGKNLYQNHIIPEAINRDEQEMESLGMLEDGVRIETSFDHLPVLAKNRKEDSETLRNNTTSSIIAFKNNAITYDEYCRRNENPEPYSKWVGKYWLEFKPEEKAQFDNSHNNSNNGNNNGNQTDNGRNTASD